MKKYIYFFITAVMVVFTLTGCHINANKQSEQSEKFQIVTTIFPAYDWVRQIMGDAANNAELTMLLDNGVDLHNYQPTADDLIKISTCDMFIYVGGESDGWVEDALKNAVNKDMVVINMMELMGDSAKEEEMVEGMQESQYEHEDESERNHLDEHVWLSLKNAKLLCREIACRSHCCHCRPYHESGGLPAGFCPGHFPALVGHESF